MDNINVKLEILIEEYKLINEKIEQFIRNQLNYFYLILGLLGGIYSFILHKDNASSYLHFLLPAIHIICLIAMSYQFQRILVIQGYKKYLECQLNKLAKEHLVFYGHLGMKVMQNNNKLAKSNYILHGLIFLFLFGESIRQNFDGEPYLYIPLILLIVLLICYFYYLVKDIDKIDQRIFSQIVEIRELSLEEDFKAFNFDSILNPVLNKFKLY